MNELWLAAITWMIAITDWVIDTKLREFMNLRLLIIKHCIVIFSFCSIAIWYGLFFSTPYRIENSMDLKVYNIDGAKFVVYKQFDKSHIKEVSKDNARLITYESGPYYGLYIAPSLFGKYTYVEEY